MTIMTGKIKYDQITCAFWDISAEDYPKTYKALKDIRKSRLKIEATEKSWEYLCEYFPISAGAGVMKAARRNTGEREDFLWETEIPGDGKILGNPQFYALLSAAIDDVSVNNYRLCAIANVISSSRKKMLAYAIAREGLR